MNNHHGRYKKKPDGFEDVNNGRLVRAVKQEERRRDNRAEIYAKYRDVPASHETDEASPASDDVEAKLRRWQIERDLKKKIEMQKKKPVFKVSVVHHKLYSPPLSFKPEASLVTSHSRDGRKAKQHATPPKRITRATQKRLEAKKAGTTTTPFASASVRSNRTKSVKKRLPSVTSEAAASFAPENYSFKPPEGVKEVPLPKEETQLSSDNGEDQPWPHARYPAVDITSTQNSKNLLARQDVVDRLSLELPEESIQEKSPMDAFTLRLSSDEESFMETNVEETPISPEKKLNDPKNVEPGEKLECQDTDSIDEPEVAEVAKEMDESDAEELTEIAKIIETDTKTPPRSGTPVPASFSPYVVSSRGKDSARKEQKMKMGIGFSPSNDVPTKDTVMQNLNISLEEEEKTAQYFKFIMQREIDSLTKMCNEWAVIMKEPDLTEDAQYQINQAIGQTNLLIRKKIARFRSLVSDCETGKGEMLVQCRDLQGFWDMVNMEVKDCESRFLKLHDLREKGWVEEETVMMRKKITRKKSALVTTKVNAKSSARSWIVAARKKKMLQNQDVDTNEIVIAVKDATKSTTRWTTEDKNARRSSRKSLSTLDSNTRRSGPITPSVKTPSVKTPSVKTPSLKTPSVKTPTSLLRQVQLSQATKNIRSPLAVMKISKMWKTPEVKLDDTISYVNSDQTPAKGILKKSDVSTALESCPPKSTRKVDFNEKIFLNEVPVENELNEDLQNSMDLGRALARIDSCGEYDLRAEKRLDFEHDSFDETEDTDTAESAAVVAAVPSLSENSTIHKTTMSSPEVALNVARAQDSPVLPIVQPITSGPSHETREKSRRTSRRSEKFNETSLKDDQSVDTGTRVLRNRTVVAETPSKKNRRSVRSSANFQHNISMDSSTKENNDPLRESQKESTSSALDIDTVVPATPEFNTRRRSSRKSAKMNADDCVLCTPKAKPVVTPRMSRSGKNVSLLEESSRKSVAPSASAKSRKSLFK